MAAVIVGLDSVIAWGNYAFQIDRLDWHTNWVEMNSQLSCTDTGHHIASIAVPPSRLCSLFKRPSFCGALSFFLLFSSSTPQKKPLVRGGRLLLFLKVKTQSHTLRHGQNSDDTTAMIKIRK